MDEMSYQDALAQGVQPIQYRTDRLEELGEGRHEGVLDALVWTKSKPALQALITLDSGVKIMVMGFQRHSRKELAPYLGLREFSPGDRVTLVIDRGLRGGLRPAVLATA